MILKRAGIALKGPQNSMEAQAAHRRVEVSHFYLISFHFSNRHNWFLQSYLRCVMQLSYHDHGSQTCDCLVSISPDKLMISICVGWLAVLWLETDLWFTARVSYRSGWLGIHVTSSWFTYSRPTSRAIELRVTSWSYVNDWPVFMARDELVLYMSSVWSWSITAVAELQETGSAV